MTFFAHCVENDTGSPPNPGSRALAGHEKWPEGSHCCDFFFVSPALGQRVVELAVDPDCDASDHQPVLLVLRD